MPLSETKKGIHLFIRVTPNAKVTVIEDITQLDNGQKVVKVKVTAPPDKGKANKAVIVLLSKFFKIPKSRISVVAGATSRTKTILIEAADHKEIMSHLLGPNVAGRDPV